MQRYHEYQDGCEPDDNGEWVYWDEAEAELGRLRAEVERSETVARECAIELKEWRILFPNNDPTIARRMVEDRARAEAHEDLRAEVEKLRAELAKARSAYADSEHRNVLLHRELERTDDR